MVKPADVATILQQQGSSEGTMVDGIAMQPLEGLGKNLEPLLEVSNEMDLLHYRIKQEPEDHFMFNECLDIKQEAGTYLVPTETIFLPLGPKEESVEANVLLKMENSSPVETVDTVLPPEKLYSQTTEVAKKKCTQCKHMFKSRLEFLSHSCTKQGKDWHCEICSMFFATKRGLGTHNKRLHNGSVKSNIFSRNVTTCVVCKLQFDTAGEFLSHACETVEKCHFESTAQSEMYRCKPCKQDFDSKLGINAHMRLIHPHLDSKNSKTASEITKQALKSYGNVFQEFYNHTCMFHMKGNGIENPSQSYSLLIETQKWNFKNCYECLECSAKCESNGNRNSEHSCYRNKELIRCKVCSKCHVDYDMMERHLKYRHEKYWKHLVDEQTHYSCIMCEKLFANCLQLEPYDGLGEENISIKFKHIQVIRIFSNDCFSFKYKIESPVSNNHFSWNYVCVLCKSPSFFTTEMNLESHLTSFHKIDWSFRNCSWCHQMCYRMNSFYDHVKNECTNSELDFENFGRTGMLISTCFMCSIDFVNNCSAEIHRLSEHWSEKFNIKLISGTYTCPNCKVIFSDLKLFYAHCAPYSALFPDSYKYCEQCSIMFQTPDDYKSHSIAEHNEPHCFKCKICDTRRESQSQIDNHVSMEHNTQVIHCTKCYVNVRVEPEITLEHFKNCFTNLTSQLFSCPICGLRFDTLNMLFNHITIDIQSLTARSYQCKHCLNYFYSKYNLCVHIFNTICESCGLCFCSKQKLADHIALKRCTAVNSQQGTSRHT